MRRYDDSSRALFPASRWKWLYPVFAAGCLAWLVLRTGRKPSRFSYPCQQAAAFHSAWLIPAAGLLLARTVRSERVRRSLSAVLVVAMLAFLAVGLGGDPPAVAVGESAGDLARSRAVASSMTPAAWNGGQADGSHDVAVVNHVPAPSGGPHHSGVDALVHLLAEGGVHFFRSDADAFCAAPDGIIAPDDVVLLKVNAAFSERGMTNTDVVKGLIAAILEHPDGFTGEVVVVENCEGGPDYNQQYNNADNIYQSFQVVVDSFGDPSRVSSSSWWSFTDNLVGEFDTGDYNQGYVWVGNNVSYPKFSTGRGTCISLKNGIWNGSSYVLSRMKLINVPVLKSHNTTGITACLKNFMGVPSIHRTTNVHPDLVYSGFMGRMMNQVIYPDLNVLDAIWVSPSHPQGPSGPYSLAVRTNILLAGVDPVALDYYAGRNILYPVSGYGRHDPDTPFSENTNPYHDGTRNVGYPYNALRIMLDVTTGTLQQGGHDVTSDPSRMNVRVRDLSRGLGWSGGHCVSGVREPGTRWQFAEGTTRNGFEEWLTLENPQGETANAHLAFMTGDGETFDMDMALPPGSRGTVHVNRVVGQGKDVSCSVTSDRPIVAERPMYFSYGAGGWRGGHDVVGASDPVETWYFAEGYTGPGFEQYVCVLNPDTRPASLRFRFQTEEEGEIIRAGQSVPARTRSTFKINDLLGANYQNSLVLESDRPVVAERALYFDYLGKGDHHWDGGHCVMGAPSLSREYFFAEGTTRDGFEEWLTLQNPNPSPLSVTATYHLGDGQGDPVTRTYTVGAEKRYTVFAADEVGTGKDVSVKLSAPDEFLAERSIYFNYQGFGANWPDGHCVIGVPERYDECYFAEGYTGGSFQEWLCLQNPGNTDSTVEATYYTEEKGALEPRYITVPARTRVTVRVNDNAGPNLQLSCRLRVTSGPDVVAERPMYFDYW